MISNIADRTDARILSNHEIDAVAGGCGACWALLGAATVFAGAAAYGAYNSVRDSTSGSGTAAPTGGRTYEARGDQTYTETTRE
jgi:hypothetical protein